MPIERFATPNQFGGTRRHTPRVVVVHTTDGSFAAAAEWFGRRDAGVRAHYLVGLDGRVAQFVDEHDTARHAGVVHEPAVSPPRGSLAMWQTGTWPGHSNLNFLAGAAFSNNATSAVVAGTPSTVKIRASTTTHVIVDVLGYYA